MKKLINKIEDYPNGLDTKAYRNAVANMRVTCGITYEMAEVVAKIFTKELADALAHNGVLDIPHLGTFYYFHRTRDKQNLSFRISSELKSIKKKGGTDENNFIRAVQKSSNRNPERDEDGIDSGE